MKFSDIIGQEAIKKRLIQTVREQRIPHAQLLCGPAGVGKLQLAIAYAQYISCTNRTETDSCGQCPSCIKYAKLQHPDLHFVFPIVKPGDSKSVVCDEFGADFRKIILEKKYFSENEWYSFIGADSKSGTIYANESSEILRKLSLKTYESEYKVMIIWLPEKMNPVCANKLLKILEEPPEKTVFLLVSNQPENLLATILSRTQRINVPRIEQNEIADALCAHNASLTREAAANLAHIANGSYLNALRLEENDDENRLNFERFVQLMRWAWLVGNKRDYAALMSLRKWSEDMAASGVGRERQKYFLQYSQRLVRENFIYNVHQPALNYMTSDEEQFSQKFAAFINERNVEDLMNELEVAEKQIEQNTNAKMVFFDISLKIIMLLKR